jgi:hypothetical protein
MLMKKQQQQSSMQASGVEQALKGQAGLHYEAASLKAATIEASQHHASTPAFVTEPTWKLYCDCRLKSFLSGR